ncbi:hypothetical protein CMUS01_06526 [Colletotrichum musicola]|uniref:Uncharacterized protein n=1 Tax=Colletotrichum musicola TaxID=2175873 RepID=A0A8H6KL34_9PEZI|nr:hypothetical protein CMUS01_06526 [Colletotrichum musicola]
MQDRDTQPVLRSTLIHNRPRSEDRCTRCCRGATGQAAYLVSRTSSGSSIPRASRGRLNLGAIRFPPDGDGRRDMSAAGWTVLQSNPSLAADLSLIHPSLAEMAGLIPETTVRPYLTNDGPNRSCRRARPSELEPEPEPGGLERLHAKLPGTAMLPLDRRRDAPQERPKRVLPTLSCLVV